MLLAQPDLLLHILSELTRQDAITLSVTCDAVHRTFVQLQAGPTPLYTPAPRVVICASDTQQLLLMPLTPEGQPYMCLKTQHNHRTRRQMASKCQLQAISGRGRGRKQWLTGVAFSPYDLALYVAAYGTGTAPASIFRFSPGKLRPSGCLVSGSDLYNPEGLAFAKQACYMVCAADVDRNSSIVAFAAGSGSTLQALELSGGAAWGMAAWDPSTYPAHRLAAEQAACNKQQHNQQGRQQQQQHDSPQTANNETTAGTASGAACSAAALDEEAFRAQAAQGCLLVAVQGDVHKDDYWAPPTGPASGALLCVPLSGDGRMSAWKEWSRVKIKRPSGITFDHAGHVWTTSLERLLLRLAGPCHPSSGHLLQTVDLVQLLPPFAHQLYPMDVQAAVQVPAGGNSSQHTATLQDKQEHGAGLGAAQQAGSSLLIVTVHAGSEVPAAVAVLKLKERVCVDGPQHARTATQEGHIRLVECWQDRMFQQPNMVAIQEPFRQIKPALQAD